MPPVQKTTVRIEYIVRMKLYSFLMIHKSIVETSCLRGIPISFQVVRVKASTG